MRKKTAFRVAVGLALAASCAIVWLNAAAGLIGIEDDDPANLLYAGVLSVMCGGALLVRMQPGGLAHVMIATAAVQALVTVIALMLPNTASTTEILLVHGAFVLSFAIAGSLFRYAGRPGP